MGPYLSTPNKEKHPEDGAKDNVRSVLSTQQLELGPLMDRVRSESAAATLLQCEVTLQKAVNLPVHPIGPVRCLYNAGMVKHPRRLPYNRNYEVGKRHPALWSVRWAWGPPSCLMGVRPLHQHAQRTPVFQEW